LAFSKNKHRIHIAENSSAVESKRSSYPANISSYPSESKGKKKDSPKKGVPTKTMLVEDQSWMNEPTNSLHSGKQSKFSSIMQ